MPTLVYPAPPPSVAEIAEVLIALGALLLVPLAAVWWLRARALAARAADPGPAWFGFARNSQCLLVGWWAAWITEVHALNATRLVLELIPVRNIGLTASIPMLLYFVPPALVTVAAAALSHAVVARLRGSEWTLSETVTQAAWQQAALVVPALCVVLGVSALLSADPRGGAGWMLGALFSRVLLAHSQMRAMGIAPHALTAGPLRDRIFSLATLAGVKLQQLYVVPMARGRMANAFAVRNHTVVLTDYLLEHLSRREVDAVMAHELSHLKHHHPARLMIVLVTGWVVAYQLVTLLHSWAIAAAVALLTTVALFNLVARHFERVADLGAISITGDPEALITGLARLNRLNHLPLDWGRWDETLLTHPSTVRRARAVGARAGLGPERIDELLRSSHAADEHYPSPVLAPGRTKIFSTVFKRESALRLAWTMLAIYALTPAAFAALASVVHLGTRGVVDAVACMATLALSLLTLDRLAVRAYQVLAPRLHQRLVEQGLDPRVHGGLFIGFSPGTAPRIYEGFYDWDVGYLFLRGDRLCMIGEETRFELRRDQVASIGAGETPPGWIRAPRIELHWQDATTRASGSFTLRPADVPRLSRASRAALELRERLEAWRSGAGPPESGESPLCVLGLPTVETATGISPRALGRLQSLAPALVLTALSTACACALFGLPLETPRAPGFADVFVVALIVHMFHRVPYWRWRERPAISRRSESATLARAA